MTATSGLALANAFLLYRLFSEPAYVGSVLAERHHLEPEHFPWDHGAFPLGDIISRSTNAGVRTVDCELAPQSFFLGFENWPTYWVDGDVQIDGGNGLSKESPFGSISSAVKLANSRRERAVIRVKAGFYDRSRNFSAGGIFPEVDMVFQAYGGRAVVTTAELLYYTPNLNSRSYSSKRKNCSRVFDLLNVDETGFYNELERVESEIIVSDTPGTWTETDGNLIVHRADGLEVTNANTRVLIAVDNFRLQGERQVSCLITGNGVFDGFDLEGGQAGAIRIAYTGGVNDDYKVFGVTKGHTFRYSGHSLGAVGNVAIEGLNGLAIIDAIDASCGASDCINFHNALGAKMFALVKNATGYDGGRFSYKSNNGITGHDNMTMIVLGGRYYGNKGVNAHIIDNCKAWFVGVACGLSKGDKMHGGGNIPCNYKTEDTAEMWLDSCSSDTLGGGVSIVATDNSSVRFINMYETVLATSGRAEIMPIY